MIHFLLFFLQALVLRDSESECLTVEMCKVSIFCWFLCSWCAKPCDG
uniref:Uncharacterized protein n=1 Tax=Rhizophora mucronata TaxID=61149 RepID=A0A2P2K837_RHIMU